MSNINFFNDEINVEKKIIILRADFNVPIVNNKIQDKTRIDLCIPFIKSILKKKAKLIIISHLGRPKDTDKKKFSLKPVFDYLKKELEEKIFFFTDKIDKETKNKISFLKEGEIILLENIRYNDGEVENSNEFSKLLAGLGDIYINDAFSCSHRMQSSVHKVVKFSKKFYAGPLLRKEIEAINIIINSKKKPITCIIGGSKVSTKIGVLNSLIKKVDYVVLVGAMANNFLLYQGYDSGKSLIEKDSQKIIENIYNNAKKENCEIVIPKDCIVSDGFEGNPLNKNLNEIDLNDIILDIGHRTINEINSIIDKSKIVLWNGPAGYFENKNFSKGTISIAKKISDETKKNTLLSIVGGGDTLAALKMYASNLKFTHLSTAGGAFLEYLEGKNLPGIEVLK